MKRELPNEAKKVDFYDKLAKISLYLFISIFAIVILLICSVMCMLLFEPANAGLSIVIAIVIAAFCCDIGISLLSLASLITGLIAWRHQKKVWWLIPVALIFICSIAMPWANMGG